MTVEDHPNVSILKNQWTFPKNPVIKNRKINRQAKLGKGKINRR